MACYRDVDKHFNRQELSVHRQFYKNPLLQIVKPVEGLSARKIELTAVYFPQLRAIIYTPVATKSQHL